MMLMLFFFFYLCLTVFLSLLMRDDSRVFPISMTVCLYGSSPSCFVSCQQGLISGGKTFLGWKKPRSIGREIVMKERLVMLEEWIELTRNEDQHSCFLLVIDQLRLLC